MWKMMAGVSRSCSGGQCVQGGSKLIMGMRTGAGGDGGTTLVIPWWNAMGLTLCSCVCHGLCGTNTPRQTVSTSPFLPVAITMPSLLAVLLDSPPAPPEDPRSFWSSAQHSPNFTLSLDRRVAQRVPTEQSTDSVRGEVGLQGGLHVWQVDWDPAERGSHAVIGVSTQHCPLQTSGYTVLVGGDGESWGWELGSNQLWHNNAPMCLYPRRQSGDIALKVPATVLMVLDGDAGTLGFVVDGCYLGTALWGLPHSTPLFPAASSVWGGCRIGLRYLNGGPRELPSLMSLCRLCVRQAAGGACETTLDRLGLPPALRRLV
ncbi:SPRY domain-containing SOCS box protein 4-like [Arapaima gigas]